MFPKAITITLMLMLFLNNIFAEQLSGSVKYDGKAMPKIPKTQLKSISNDPYCGSTHKEPVYKQGLIVNENKTLKNVLVYLKDAKYDSVALVTQAVIDQNGCTYSPHVQGMMAGQELLIKNSDATLHNIHGLPVINSEFNFAMPKVVKEKAIKLEKAEHPIKIKCDVHPWMKAYVSVFDHPYFAVTNDTGRYQIDNVPPGKYEVVVWHERDLKYLGYSQTQSVDIGDGGTTLDFALTKGEKKKK